MRNLRKYADAGQKRVKKHEKYDLTCSEIHKLMEKASKSQNNTLDAILDAFCIGVEAGARMTKKQYKEGRC